MIEPCLELVGNDQDVELGTIKRVADIALQARVQGLVGLRECLRSALWIIHLTREGSKRSDAVAFLMDVFLHGDLPAHSLLTAADNHHRLGPTAQERHDVGAVVLDDDGDLLGNVPRV